MSVCAKAKVFTDFLLNNRSWQLDHTNLKYNPTVKAIRALHDGLADALHNGELRHRYDVIKGSIKNPVLINKETYQKKIIEGKLPLVKKSKPRQDLYKRVQKMENEIFLSDEGFNANEMSLLQYEQRDAGIRELFHDDVEFHQYMSARYDLYKTLSDTGIPLSRYFVMSKSAGKDFANNLLKDIESNEVLAILTNYSSLAVKTFEELQDQLAKDIYKDVPDIQKSAAKKKEVDALARDMVFQIKPEGDYIRLLEAIHNETRSAVIPLKYTVGMESGQRLLVQNTILGSIQLYSRSAGMSDLTNSELLRLLQDDAGILKSEIRLEPNVEYGEGWFDRLGAIVANVTKGNKIASVSSTALARIAQGGWHNAWDMMADPWAKNVCIAEAMAEMGISGHNMKMYEEQYKKGIMMPNLIDEIRVRAHDKYAAFFTNSKTASRTTNRFSLTSAKGKFSGTLFLATNFMQGYAMKRASQIISAATDLKSAIQLGKVSDIQSFKRWLDGPEGGEIRNIILNSLYAAKLAVYIETNQTENDYLTDVEKMEKIKQFTLGLNDFINSAGSSIPGRMIGEAIKYGTSEYITADSNGNTTTEQGSLPMGVIGFLKEGVDTVYKEFKVFDLAPALINALANGTYEEAAAITDQILGKVINGIGRYSLTPGTDIYGMAIVHDTMDSPLEWLMIKNESNQSMIIADKIRTMQDISAFVDSPGAYSYDYLINHFIPLNTVLMFGDKPDAISKEASYSVYKDLIRKDPIANNLYNGIFDDKVLYTKEEAIAIGKPEYANVSELYKSLTTYNNIEMGNDTLVKLGSDYGIADGTFDAIMQKLVEDIGPQTYQAMIVETNPKMKDRQAAILQATAEAKIPGAGRLMLSYIADKEYKAELKSRYNVTDDNLIPPIAKENLQKAIIAEYGNQLLLTDKYAQVSLLTQRANQLHPNFLKENDDLTRIVNSSILTDMLIHQGAKNGDVNARYLGSILSITGKYMPDNLRLPIIEKTFYQIDKMNISENIKTVLKTGVGLGNVDFIGKIAKDPVASKKYSSMINNVLNLIYNTQETSAKQPNPIALDTGDYSKTTGKAYSKGGGGYGGFKKSNSFSNDLYQGKGEGEESKSTQDNFVATQMLAKKIVGLPPFKRNKVIDLSNHNTDAYKSSPKNPLEEFYVKVLESQKQAAQSQKLDNSVDMNKIGQQSKPNGAKIGYKSKKWKTAKLALPKIKKAKPVTYKG